MSPIYKTLHKSLISIVILIDVINSSVTTQATFKNYLGGDSSGYVTIYSNLVWWDLDFINVNWSIFDTPNCTEEGLSFHIHDKWTYGDSAQSIGQGSADRIGKECHSNFTGKHFDPWMACGPSSANPECIHNGGCIPPSSIYEESSNYQQEYSCDPSNFDLIAYACEVGDLSGKYRMLDPIGWSNDTNDTIGLQDVGLYGSYWEVLETVLSPGLVNGMPAMYSLVIHCGDAEGEPLFCAPIVRENNPSIPQLDLTDPEIVEIDLTEAGSDFDNFTIEWTNEGVTFHIPASTGALCNEWYLMLYEEYPHFEEAPARKNCDIDEFGGIYDPTHTCIQDSGSKYCQDEIRCPHLTNVSVTYYCGSDDNYMGCAVGDVSSRIGSIIPDFTGGNDYWHQLFPLNSYSPPLFILADRGVVLKCLDPIGNFNETTNNICGGTFCDNCTQTLAPVDSNPPTMDTTGPTKAPTIPPSNVPTTTNPTKPPVIITTQEPNKGDGKTSGGSLGGGAIAGIAIAIVVVLIVIFVLLWCFVIKPRRDYNNPKESIEINKMASNSARDTEALNTND